MNKTIALIAAGGKLDLLSKTRSKSALPFAGKFRLIDFTLSNCIDSGLENIGVVTQYMPNSLKEHIGIGKPWDLDRANGGITILQPFKGKPGDDWYLGDAQSVYKNISFIENKAPDEILLLPGHLVYKMDYQKILKEHRKNNADLTIAVNNIPYSDTVNFSTLDYDENLRLLSIEQEIEASKNLASMGVFLFKKEILIEALKKYCSQGAVDFHSEIIPNLIAENKDIFISKFDGYWRDISSVESYWKTNIELAEKTPEIDLYDRSWPIYTRSEEKPPVKFGPKSSATKSLIANGAIVNGRIEGSVIAPGVYVEEGAFIKNSVILNNCTIRKNAMVNKTIIDKNVEIKENAQIGSGSDFTINSDSRNMLKNGLNLIAKDIIIEKNIRIHRNCRINKDINRDEFKNNEVLSGTTVS